MGTSFQLTDVARRTQADTNGLSKHRRAVPAMSAPDSAGAGTSSHVVSFCEAGQKVPEKSAASFSKLCEC